MRAKQLAVAAVVASVLVISAEASAQTIQTTEAALAFTGASESDGAASMGDTVYTRVNAGQDDLFFVDLAGIAFPIVTGAGNQANADIDAGFVVFENDAAGNLDVGFHDMNVGSTGGLAFTAAQEHSAAISGNNVVFISNANGTDDVWWFELSLGFAVPVAITPGSEFEPDVDGSLAAWATDENGDAGNVYAVELGGTPFAVAATAAIEHSVRVSGNLIAYITDDDVAVYDHSTGQTTLLTNDVFTQRDPVVHGQNVFWVDDRNGNDDIFMHSLAFGQTYQLTTDPSDQVLTDATDDVAHLGFDGRVVFHDSRFGNSDLWTVLFSFPCPWDIDADGTVAVPDLLTLLAGWGTSVPDFDGDGVVAVPDLLTLLAAWGACP